MPQRAAKRTRLELLIRGLGNKHSETGALYQGMTSVVPQPPQNEPGFSR